MAKKTAAASTPVVIDPGPIKDAVARFEAHVRANFDAPSRIFSLIWNCKGGAGTDVLLSLSPPETAFALRTLRDLRRGLTGKRPPHGRTWPDFWAEHIVTLSVALSRRPIDLSPEFLESLLPGPWDGENGEAEHIINLLTRFVAKGNQLTDVAGVGDFLHSLSRFAIGHSDKRAQEYDHLLRLLAEASPVVAKPTFWDSSYFNRTQLPTPPGTPLYERFAAALHIPENATENDPVRFDESALTEWAAEVADINFRGRVNRYGDPERSAAEALAKGKRLKQSSVSARTVSFACAAWSALTVGVPAITDDASSSQASAMLDHFYSLASAVAASSHTLSLADISAANLALSRGRPVRHILPWHTLMLDLTAEAALKNPSAAEREPGFALAAMRLREVTLRSGLEWDAVERFDRALGIGANLPVRIGEQWTDAAAKHLRSLPPASASKWARLLGCCANANGAKPTTKWLAAATSDISALGTLDQIAPIIGEWLGFVGKSRPAMPGGPISGRESSIPAPDSADTLRGLAWILARHDTPASAKALGDLAMASFKMVPGHGARCQKAGTGAIWALQQHTNPHALGQLARVRQLVKFGTAQKQLDAALGAMAERLGITTDELHEIATPDFGLDAHGSLTETADDFTLTIHARPEGSTIRITDGTGKERKSIPDVIKKDHAELLKHLRLQRDDIDAMLEAQRARLDALMADDRHWTYSQWRSRYIDHPLVGVLARQLIWEFAPPASKPTDDHAWTAALCDPSTFLLQTVDGQPLAVPDDHLVRLWHPIRVQPATAAAWRARVESLQLRQPFKQAHREVYPLTPAEINTGTYSNRYAAHILKQHAFQRLAAARNWKSTLRLLVDDEYPAPCRTFPQWGIRAEYWVQGAGEDTTETGSFLYLTTDQVRFYRIDAAVAHAHAGGGAFTVYAPQEAEHEPIPLEQIPALLFSEVMRDVDLFVAGASIGADAAWTDGGRDGGFNTYWQSYSFGSLGPSARQRKELIADLLPRLAIAPHCSIEGDFLHVRGSLHTYRIHFGSGNILMAPSDTYLCIVTNSADNAKVDRVYLPFAGDQTLSVILSKAIMLADDASIKDPTITAQLKRAKH